MTPTSLEVEAVITEGFVAYATDTSNPYSVGTWQYSAWEDGNMEAYESRWSEEDEDDYCGHGPGEYYCGGPNCRGSGREED